MSFDCNWSNIICHRWFLNSVFFFFVSTAVFVHRQASVHLLRVVSNNFRSCGYYRYQEQVLLEALEEDTSKSVTVPTKKAATRAWKPLALHGEQYSLSYLLAIKVQLRTQHDTISLAVFLVVWRRPTNLPRKLRQICTLLLLAKREPFPNTESAGKMTTIGPDKAFVNSLQGILRIAEIVRC